MQLSIVPKEDNAPAAEPLCVLKFGGSVLRTLEDLPRVVGEIYRQRRGGRRVVAIVSALEGETDALFAAAASAGGGRIGAGVADLVSLGEERAAALLRIACDRIGLAAVVCRPEALRLVTEGGCLDARPVRLDRERIDSELNKGKVVLVPGFVGIDANGERALLGRGGSDLSAVFLGAELDADRVRLYKDVDGLFDRDPALHSDARRFAALRWDDAAKVAGSLVQTAAVRHASARRLPVEVGAIGGEPTLIGPFSSEPQSVRPRPPLRIALAGYGVVGQALAARLAREANLDIVSILVRDVTRPRAVPPPCPLTDDPERFLAVPADVTIDVLSCDRTGASLCGAVLPAGRHVVSASKRVVSTHRQTLNEAALRSGALLLYSAAVGGAAPVLETVAAARSRGPVCEVAAILNGTVNYILDRLHAGQDFDAAFDEARRGGFAEEDSSADLSGADAAAKLRLIAAEAFDADSAAVEVTARALDAPLAARIAQSGERWVQLARLSRSAGAIQARVDLVPAHEVPELPVVPDEWNCAAVTGADGKVLRCLGRGAGGAATAEAIVADLFQIWETRAGSSCSIAAA